MNKPPLWVHIVFHPESDSARELALVIHHALNDDPAVPGLRIPTLFCAETNDYKPPSDQGLDEAKNSFVIILADDEMNCDATWCSFAADLWEQCQGSQHRCLPIQLSEDAWPLDPRLSGTNFVRAFGDAIGSVHDLVIQRMVTELCRYLHGDQLEDDNPGAPTTVFISHTKLDIEKKPTVVHTIQKYLNSNQPIKTWFDSGDIAGGSVFEREISKGVADSSLLCVVTDNYASREWCRKEVLLAKKEQRPIVVIDALSERETRSFPYLGNLPVLRWNGKPETAINLLLKETLRHLYSEAMMKQWCESNTNFDTDAVIFTIAPELLTLIDHPADSKVLYPDPPLGVEEMSTLTQIVPNIYTPLERLAKKKSLNGKKVALSMSKGNDLKKFGFANAHFEAAMLELTRYLLVQGATLAYGGHLGPDGYTMKLIEMVRAHNQLSGVDPVQRLENYYGWPLPFDKKVQGKYKFLANIKRIPRPDDVNESLHPDCIAEPTNLDANDSAEYRYAWARGMTEMRSKETADTCARIILGGKFGPSFKPQPDGSTKENWYSGRIPGVFEEAILSIKAGQPLFIIGAFGGVARILVDILEGRERSEITWNYQKKAPHAEAMCELYTQRGQDWLDYPDMITLIKEKGIKDINPYLSENEHKELFHTRDVMRMVELIIKGLNTIP